MVNESSQVNIKLSPIASIALIIVLAIGAGVVYMVKPELFNKYFSQATSGAVDTLPKDSYYPQIESSLKLMLKGQLLTDLSTRQASQAEFDAIKEIQVDSITAKPVGYFQNEMAFWHESNLRYVNLEIAFTAGGKRYKAKGDFTVSGASDKISFGLATLVK